MKRSGRALTARVGYLVGIGIFAKFFVDTTIQLFNPYLLVYAAGIGVSGITLGRLISLRNISGLVAPVIGTLADRYGYRRILRLNLLLMACGVLLFAFGYGTGLIIPAMMIWGIGQGGFAPNIHSYLSARLPYEKRSRYLGMIEYSWAAAGIIGLSVLGVLIEAFNWRVPLFVLGGGLIFSALIIGTLPKAEQTDTGQTKRPQVRNQAGLAARIREFFDLGPYRSSAWGAVLVNVFNFFALFHIIIAHGAFLETEYALSPARLGSVAFLMGLFDWAGSILVSTAGDRIGKRRSLIIGAAGLMIFAALLPLLNLNLSMALFALLMPRFFFEFATVSNFPLLSEQYPAGRGKVLAFGIAGGLIGSTIAAATGPSAYLNLGLWGLGPVSAAAALVSLLLLLFLVKERPG